MAHPIYTNSGYPIRETLPEVTKEQLWQALEQARLLNAECERQRKEAWEQVKVLKGTPRGEWTREPPTREGYYWHALSMDGDVWSIVPARVYANGHRLWVRNLSGTGRRATATPTGNEWWARMEVPEAPQQEG